MAHLPTLLALLVTAAVPSALVQQASAGDPHALRAIAAARAGTDAAVTESIDRALSEALQVNPAAVLHLIRSHPAWPRVAWYCEDRAIEPTVDAHARYLRRAERAVAAVRDPALRQVRDRCLSALRAGPS